MTTSLVPAAWRDELVLALRLRDASGARIGDALAEVEEFCADSGQDAVTAFGDPREYAASLTSAADTEPPRLRDDVRAAGRVVVGFVGLVIVLAAVGSGPDLVVTAGWLIGVPLMLGGAVVTIAALGQGRTIRSVLVVALVLAAVVALGLLLDAPLATVPDWLALTVGGTLLVGDAVVGTVRARRRPSADLVTAPGEDPAETRRRNVRSDVLLAWMLVGFALVGVLVIAGLDALVL
ncbi:hypothetical protein [Cellulomonas xylanilytica]|uniref:Uncharacterized protein n=1 Tax=Cellulomonas xylanilytica TaxID=233583 RepID=A0A510V8H6_9CELL|nr:hypothetical protein [Cellulomonas xylanilytica]GEK23178.1 hypothetical protein CXY01_36980 [Cellulomonas xylanilytica]